MIKILKNKKLILSFFIWLLSIGLFDLFFSLKKVGNYTNIELIFLAQIIGIGIVSFIIFILTLERIFHKKYSNLKARIFSSLSFIFFIIFGLSLIILPLVILNNEGSSELVKQTQASKNTLVSSGLKLGSSGEEVKLLQAILSTDKQIYPSGIVSGYFGELTKQAVINFQSKYNLTQTGEIDQQTADKINEVYGDKNKDYYLSIIKNNTSSSTNLNANTNTNNIINNSVDSDPLVNCLIHANCGGGSKLLKKSICDQSTCCQIGNNWIFYENETKCKEDQQKFYSNNQFNNQNQINLQKELVFLAHNNSTILCPKEFISVVKDIDKKLSSKIDQWNSEYQKCLSNIYETDNCRLNCKDQYRKGWDNCVALYGYSGDEYKSCTDNVTNQLDSCYQTCPSMFELCKNIYWERDMLQEQIRIYCK
jgi:peptidoglycan hydrolase-like protein with peptidoglycan-binding domain